MYPLSFYEFLSALNQEELRQFIEHKSNLAPIPEIFHTRLIEFLKVYYITGGMPACVQTYLDTNNGDACRKVQQDILISYVLDISKHVPSPDIPKVTSIWNSLPAQLARENKKFLYRLVREGARARTYENALAWLEDSGLTLRARQVSAVRIPLSSYASYKAFKIYVHDVGLLGALSRLHPVVLLQGNRLFTEFRGAFTENYVAQELSARTGNKLYYWSSEGEAEVDFLIESQGEIVPLEVKAGLGIKSKSLRVFAEKTGSSRLFRTGLRNFSSSQIIRHFPLYAVANSPRFPN
jgi:predicted AAA+ superfamily ATPase